MSDSRIFEPLVQYLSRVPAVSGPIGCGTFENGNWWVKFAIQLEHPLAWSVVQEFGHVLNYLSLDERLPTMFMPVSPPPYLNGGPKESLSWVIESQDPCFEPTSAADWLSGRLPSPVEDLEQWSSDGGI